MKKPVLVLGGGIAGIQASLDLAEMEVPVFLVESGPSIGGRMAQLDKTFPTNDCSACILAPKVTECFNHRLVNTFTWSELVELKGEAPDFTAVIKKKPRFIDEEKCIGCGACSRRCPIEVPSEFDMGLANRAAVYKPYAQAVPNKVVIDKKGTSPCRVGCPAHISAHGCISLVAKGRFDDAINLIRKVTPFVGSLGYACDRSCEGACYRQYVDEPVAIGSMHQFLADYQATSGKAPKIPLRKVKSDHKVAIIGGGPSGLNAAYQLALQGYPVTVYAKEEQPGGSVREENPKLPADLFDKEIQFIEDLGVEIVCGAQLDRDYTIASLQEQGVSAIVMADPQHQLQSDAKTRRVVGMSGVWAMEALAQDKVSLVESIAEGNRLAVAVGNALAGTDLPLDPQMLPQTPVEQVRFPLKPPAAKGEQPTSEGSDSLAPSALTNDWAVAESNRCLDCSICSECRICEQICPPKAVRHEQRDEFVEVEVSGVVLSTGYDAAENIPAEYGYGVFPNVVTSLEYERILNASGPFEGHVQRPSDGKAPKRIAFIQCVGSRDRKCDSDYCSAVCCMYAIKEAVITQEHLPTVEDIDIFYMDMRAYGKDFDKYLESAKNKNGVGFIQSRVADIAQDEDGNLHVKHLDAAGNVAVSQYDLVVLSVGLQTTEASRRLMDNLQLKADTQGFCWVHEMQAPQTSRDGVFACGVLAGPKDIPETVVEAGAAAAAASQAAGSRDVPMEQYQQFFAEETEKVLKDVAKEPLRIGVFVCHCGSNIGGFLDVKAVANYAKSLPFVEHAAHFTYACSLDTQKTMADRIAKHKLNRVVVASCTPRTHEGLFQGVLTEAGLNPYLLAMSNIREQCSWVHMENAEEATDKAKELVRMAVGKASYAKQLSTQKLGVTKSALVIGGGMAGITAALGIADMGYPVYLVERGEELGGNAARLAFASSGRVVGNHVKRFMQRAMNHPKISVLLDATVETIDGYVGNFVTTVKRQEETVQLEHGVVVVATGATEAKPEEYSYGTEQVVTQLQLEDRLQREDFDPKTLQNVVFIQCVGSRDEQRPYCSRVCCNQAIKNARLLKQLNPDTNVFVLYRDVRSYGLSELHYKAAREAGVQFIRYDDEQKPKVIHNQGLNVQVYDAVADQELSLPADLIVLSSAIEADVAQNRFIAQLLKVPLNQDGFFLEAHAKLRPVDFATEGVYLCGLAHGPKNLQESILQGKAAAARAGTVIAKDVLQTEGTIATVLEQFCSGCGTCEQVCAYKAIEVEDIETRYGLVKRAVVNAALCKGCGTCSAACRCGAIDIDGFTDRQVLNEIEFLLR